MFGALYILYLLLVLGVWFLVPLNTHSPVIGIFPRPVYTWIIIFVVQQVVFWAVAWRLDVYKLDSREV